MKGKRETVWAVIISATLITAGLILSCGDDDVAPTCQNACKKLVEDCEGMFDEWWETVEECAEDCEEGVEWKEVEIRCLLDVSCDDLGQVCLWCGWACGVIDECEFEVELPGGVEDLDTCYEECKKEDDGIMFDYYAGCVLDMMFGDCVDILVCFEE